MNTKTFNNIIYLFISQCLLLLSNSYIFSMEPTFNLQKKLFLFIGLPGGGKSTVSQAIAKKYTNVDHQSVGDLLREESKSNTERGKLIHNLISQGKLVPFETTLQILGDYLSRIQKPIILLDGYQGTKDYIAPFHNLLAKHKIELIKTLFFNVSINTAIERCKSRMRSDDTYEILQKRLEIRLKNLTDIQDWYATKELLVHIDGNSTIEAVIAETEAKIFC